MERFDKEQIGVKEPFLVTCANLLQKDKEHLALRDNLRVTKKFLITKFDCSRTKVPKVTFKFSIAMSSVIMSQF